jgi:hypothetical protein
MTTIQESQPLHVRQLAALRESWPEPRPDDVQSAIDRLAVLAGEPPKDPRDAEILTLRRMQFEAESQVWQLSALLDSTLEECGRLRDRLAGLSPAQGSGDVEAPAPTDAAPEASEPEAGTSEADPEPTGGESPTEPVPTA